LLNFLVLKRLELAIKGICKIDRFFFWMKCLF